MNNSRDALLKRVSIPVLASFIKEVDFGEITDLEDSGPGIHISMMDDLVTSLETFISGEDLQMILGKIEDYACSRETLYFIYGMRAGGKLLHELQGSSS